MDIEKLKQAILQAVESGLSKRKIDPKGNGKGVKRLEEGSGVSQDRLEEMYANVVAMQQEKTVNSMSPILSKKDKIGQKKDIKVQKQDKTTYQAMENKIGELKEELSFVRRSSAMFWESLEKAQKKIEELEERLSHIPSLENIGKLEVKLDVLESRLLQQDNFIDKIETTNKDKKDKVLGFSLIQKATSTGGKKYLKWYAVRQIDGRQTWVYIGSDLEKVREKIEAWLNEHPMLKKEIEKEIAL